jgi:hypothetical protein
MSLKAIWAGNTVYSKFLLAVGVILISASVFTIISVFAATAIYGVSMVELQTMLNDFSDPKAIVVLKFIQLFSAIGTFIIPAILIAYLFDRRPADYLALSKGVTVASALLVILVVICALPLINYFGDLNSHMKLPYFFSGIERWMRESEDKAAELLKHFLDMNSTADVIINVLLIAVLPAIGEELLFRGVIQRLFSEWSKNIHIGVWISAVLFSAMHMQFYGFLPRMMLGAFLGYLLVWSGSLWLPMLAHFVNNASAIIFTYLFKEEKMKMDPDKIGTESDYTSVLISVFLTAVLLFVIYGREKKRKENVPGM